MLLSTQQNEPVPAGFGIGTKTRGPRNRISMLDIARALKAAVGQHERGDLAAAKALYEQILAAQPNHVDALHLLGVIDSQEGRHADAVQRIEQAIAVGGENAVLYGNLGNAWNSLGNDEQAIVCFRRAIELNAKFADAHFNLGNVLREQRKTDEAIACYRRALELKPENAQTHNNLGIALQHSGAAAEAVAAYRRALALQPEFAEGLNNLGGLLQEQGYVDEAIFCLRKALALKPNYATAFCNLGSALKDQGSLEEAITCYRRAREIQSDYVMPHSNLLLTMQYQPAITLADLLAAHEEFDRVHAAALADGWRPHINRPDPERGLRVGFVSADFGKHPVGYFLAHVLERLDADQIETVLYSDRAASDEMTARLRAAAGLWCEARALNDEQLANRIRGDGIDVLFDLAGHTARNRLLVFARKPAPIQVTWLGYVGTTGLSAVDYVLADRYEIPPGGEQHYVEKVLRMPDGYVCYEGPADAPAVTELPALANGQVTFGSFNNPAKITRQVMEAWVRVLNRVPGSRLVLKYKGMGETSVRGRVHQAFAEQGIDPNRVKCLSWSPHGQHLAEYGRIDVALDTFPYSGGLTTCEALWMGVPVITWPGQTFASRHSLSHLTNAGFTETIGRSLEEYVELAVAWAEDLPRLAEVRGKLRQQVAASRLCDAGRFAANFSSILRDVWRAWCIGRQQETKNP